MTIFCQSISGVARLYCARGKEDK